MADQTSLDNGVIAIANPVHADSHEPVYLHPAQVFPRYDFSGGMNGELSPGFNNIRAWKFLDKDLFFVPWANVKVIKKANNQPYNVDNSEGKLVVCLLREVEKESRGSGLVVNGRNFSTVGCYQTYELASPDLWKKEKSVRLDLQSDLKDAERLSIPSSTGFFPAQARQQDALDKKIVEISDKIMQQNVLILDTRPYTIAPHDKPLYVIDSCNNGRGLGDFGKRYTTLHREFEDLMDDVFNEKKDVPQLLPPQSTRMIQAWLGET